MMHNEEPQEVSQQEQSEEITNRKSCSSSNLHLLATSVSENSQRPISLASAVTTTGIFHEHLQVARIQLRRSSQLGIQSLISMPEMLVPV